MTKYCPKCKRKYNDAYIICRSEKCRPYYLRGEEEHAKISG